MDAEFLEKEFEPVFMMNDIVNLPKYQIYLKLMIDGIAGDAFSANVLPPIKIEGDPETEAKIINSSRERYTSKKEDVEDKIRRWTGMLSPEERQALVKNVSSATPAPAPRPTPRPAASAPASVPARPRQEVKPSAPAKPGARPSTFGEGRHVSKPTVPAAAKVKPVMPPVRTVVPSAAPHVLPKTEPVPMIKTETAPHYSKEEASAVLTSALSQEPQEEIRQQAFVPPLAPKKEPFMKEEEREAEASEIIEPASVVVPQEEEKLLKNEEAAVPEKILYQAECATCGLAIEVPFKPDGSRPTFCKDCLRDYQRATAKARNEIERKQPAQPTASHSHTPERPRQHASLEANQAPHQSVAPHTYVSADRPMSLSQTKHMEPKKFKALRKHSPDLREIRALIDTAKKSGE
jgi:CxxC-x17-CxxC domain-containing protein